MITRAALGTQAIDARRIQGLLNVHFKITAMSRPVQMSQSLEFQVRNKDQTAVRHTFQSISDLVIKFLQTDLGSVTHGFRQTQDPWLVQKIFHSPESNRLLPCLEERDPVIDLQTNKRLRFLERVIHEIEFLKSTRTIKEETHRQSVQLFSADCTKRRMEIIVATLEIKKHSKDSKKSQVFNHLDPQ